MSPNRTRGSTSSPPPRQVWRLGRCLFVDDRLVDVEGARALGMTGVHYRGSEDLAVPAALG